MEDKNQKLPSTRIQWYPGHMAKTKREIINNLKLIDIVIELLDARIPIASRNPDIYAITKNKKKIILLNKAVDFEEEQERLQEEYEKEQEEEYGKAIECLNKMSKQELINELIQVFDYGPEWIYNDFVKRNDIE